MHVIEKWACCNDLIRFTLKRHQKMELDLRPFDMKHYSQNLDRIQIKLNYFDLNKNITLYFILHFAGKLESIVFV